MVPVEQERPAYPDFAAIRAWLEKRPFRGPVPTDDDIL